MESKLKSLKVAELKDILVKASVSAPTRSNKQDLIARIIANPAALDVYKKQTTTHVPPSTTAKTPLSQSDDLLAPPEDVDWNVDEGNASEPPPLPTPAAATAPTTLVSPVKPKVNSTSATTTALTETTAPSAVEDAELEKRRQRAARFGVPLIERPKSKATATSTFDSNDTEKLKARAARFGTGKPSAAITATASRVTGQKRSAPTLENVDAEELEKRKRRAERFGTKV